MFVAITGVVSSNPAEGKICLSHFTPVEREEMFCKINYKHIKIDKTVNLFKHENTNITYQIIL